MLAAIALAAALDAQAAGDGTVNLIDPPLEQPRFTERPTPGEIAGAYPHGAANLGASGHASISSIGGVGTTITVLFPLSDGESQWIEHPIGLDARERFPVAQ